MNQTICIYHENCFDGICAAWVVSRAYPEAEFIPYSYGNTKLLTNLQQDCFENANINTHYILVDVSLPRDLMIQMANKAKSMIVLDHHKTAQANCEGLDFCRFDMNESGASLAWKYFFPSVEIPRLVHYIADRDLWKFKLPHSEAVNAYIQSYPMTIESYQNLCKELYCDENFQGVIMKGQAINQYKQTMVSNICKTAAFGKIGFRKSSDLHLVPIVNTSLLFSEVGHELCKLYPEAPYAAYFYDKPAQGVRQWGLRSIGDFDVSEVAKKFKGGGHKNAAGFEQSLSEL